jgi:hypothetical protein
MLQDSLKQKVSVVGTFNQKRSIKTVANSRRKLVGRLVPYSRQQADPESLIVAHTQKLRVS